MFKFGAISLTVIAGFVALVISERQTTNTSNEWYQSLGNAFAAREAMLQEAQQTMGVPDICSTAPAPLVVVHNLLQDRWNETHLVGFHLGDTEAEVAKRGTDTISVYTNIDTGSFTVVAVFGDLVNNPMACVVAGGYGPMFSYMEDAYDLIPGTDM